MKRVGREPDAEAEAWNIIMETQALSERHREEHKALAARFEQAMERVRAERAEEVSDATV